MQQQIDLFQIDFISLYNVYRGPSPVLGGVCRYATAALLIYTAGQCHIRTNNGNINVNKRSGLLLPTSPLVETTISASHKRHQISLNTSGR